MSKFIPNPELGKQHLSDALDLLKTGIAKLDTPAGFVQHLTQSGRGNLYRYSTNNQLLILIQRPEATVVGGFHFWTRKGRKPLAGRGIRILAPATFKKLVEIEQDDGTVEEVEQLRLRFKTVTVWDIADTDGPAIPASTSGPLAPSFFYQDDEADEQVAALDDALRAASKLVLGVPVVVKDNGAAYGVFRPIENQIEVSPRHDPLTTCASTAHELAHALVHHSKTDSGTYAIEEWVAEGTSFAFLAYHGFRTDRFSFDYISGWGGTTRGIVSILGRINKLVQAMIGLLDAESQQEAVAA